MIIKVLGFGIAKDIFGSRSIEVELGEGATVDQLKQLLDTRYPDLARIRSYMIAVNSEYADGDLLIAANDEVVVIPPVSGG
jgi:molybdopterin synthase sulfur carrier subunit